MSFLRRAAKETWVIGAPLGLATAVTTAAWWAFIQIPPHDAFYGDYQFDADKSLVLALHGHVFSMFTTKPWPPLMLPVSLLIRLATLFFGVDVFHLARFGPADLWERYRLGCIACLWVATAVCAFAARESGLRGQIRGYAFAAAVPISTLTSYALLWGHPEEMLGAGLLVAALAFLGRSKYLAAAVIGGLCFATKQNFLLAAPTMLLIVPGWRLRARYALAATATFLLTTLPWMWGAYGSVFASTSTTVNTKFNPGNAGYKDNFWTAFHISPTIAARLGHPLIILIAIVLPFLIAWRHDWRLTFRQGASIVTIVMVFRVILDPGTISYYQVPILSGLAALEWCLWREHGHPARRLAEHIPVEFPFITLIAGALLGSLMAGRLEAIISGSLGSTNGKMYLLAALSFMAPLFVIATGKTMSLNRGRTLLYGTLAAAVVASVAAVAAFGQQPRSASAQLPPPFGYKLASQAHVASLSTSPYWLGPTFKGMPERVLAQAVHPKLHGFRALANYGPSGSSNGVTIFSAATPGLAKAVKMRIGRCETKGCAPMRLVHTRLGPAIYERGNATNWDVLILMPHDAVYAIVDGLNLQWQTVTADLRVVTAHY